MPALRLLTVVSASLLLLAKVDVNGNDPPQTPAPTPTPVIKYAVKLGQDGKCLSEINSARKKAGFNDFVIPQADAKQKRLPEQGDADSDNYAEWVWKPVCDVLIPVDKEEEEETPKTEETEEGSALICMTTPDVLPDNSENPPFTEEQWGQIVTAFEGSASAVLPSLLGLAAAFLGVSAAL
ncbi:SAG family member [Eimeria mitis]|uniref:SAG family member n=1 Tax=Eimeria mitis TaxID=44415 RepID=U6KBI8_9EIME|nr:SAG family member [Eimeria mitis]CDJ33602.1 SAG family member [Eimeria mitis]